MKSRATLTPTPVRNAALELTAAELSGRVSTGGREREPIYNLKMMLKRFSGEDYIK